MSALARILPDGYWQFLRSWLDAPLAVGAVAPSGKPLARKLALQIEAGQRVVELGPGTGIVTREILARGVAPADLYLIERCHGFADMLERRFPGVSVVTGDATEAQPALAEIEGRVDIILSGLPLTLFSREQKARLLQRCLQLLGPGGALIQFTYRGRCPLSRRELEQHGLRARCTGFVALNMPPASVYRIVRQDDGAGNTGS